MRFDKNLLVKATMRANGLGHEIIKPGKTTGEQSVVCSLGCGKCPLRKLCGAW